MPSISFSRMARATAAIKRADTAAGGSLATVSGLGSVACVPLAPVRPNALDVDSRQRLGGELLSTIVEGNLDIKVGDVLEVSGVQYPVRSVDKWPWRSAWFMTIIVEDANRFG